MVRTSDISALPDFEVEHLREDLRDRRSARYRRNIQAIAIAVAQVVGALTSAAALIFLLSSI